MLLKFEHTLNLSKLSLIYRPIFIDLGLCVYVLNFQALVSHSMCVACYFESDRLMAELISNDRRRLMAKENNQRRLAFKINDGDWLKSAAAPSSTV